MSLAIFISFTYKKCKEYCHYCLSYNTTTNDLYLNWNSFAQTSWKRGTLKTLIDCA